MKLVAFPLHDWRKGQFEGFRTRDLHLLEAMASMPVVESILVVDRPVSLAERVMRREPWTVSGTRIDEIRHGRSRWRLTDVGDGIVVLDQAVPDVIGPARDPRAWWFDIFDHDDTKRAVAWGIDRALGGADGAVAWLPTVSAVVLGTRLPFVFDSLDNWLIHPAFARYRDRSETAYARLLPAAEKVFVSAPASRIALQRWRPDIEVLPNGVDSERFSGSFDRPSDLPPGPVVGYAGKLAERIDSALVAAVARSMPKVSFVFIGPVLRRGAISEMHDVPNVLILGDRTYDRLPAYLANFDVGWIPHRVGHGETGGDPIKLYEYLAAGLPAMTTRIDGWERWGPAVDVVGDAEDAVRAISALLSGEIRHPRMPVPTQHTWKAIVERLLEPIAARSGQSASPR